MNLESRHLGQGQHLVELCADIGNAEGPDKYATLAQLLPRASSIHFKARYTPDAQIEATDFVRCLERIAECGDATVVLHRHIAGAKPRLAQETAWNDLDQGPLLAVLSFGSYQAEAEAKPLLQR